MGDKYRKFRVAAVQAASIFMDRDATTDKACRLILEAGREGCELVGLPEAFIPIYPYWISTTMRSKGIELYKQLYANSVDVPSPTTDRLCQAAKQAKANVVVGINFREEQGPHRGCLFNAQLFISKEGKVLGVRRKLTPIGVERAIWGVGDGSDLQVHETSVGRIGGLICGEHTMATFRYALWAAGEQIHVANWPGLFKNSRCWNWQGFGESVVRSYAMMGQTFVINACSIIDPELMEAFERNGIVDDPQARTSLESRTGFSAIVGPFGNYITGPEVSNNETLVIGEIDMQDIIEAKYAHNPLGYHDRWDVARILINYSKTGPVISIPTWPTKMNPFDEVDGVRDDSAHIYELMQLLKKETTKNGDEPTKSLLLELEGLLFKNPTIPIMAT